ncbi:MAG: FGGY-family carbohydrate kinase, partial [Myxococcota bacterium]|nr:FGGY-family carbohydrate kinase [Myxococcota bacterium]
YFDTRANSLKHRNILNDPRVCAVVESGESYFELRGVRIEGACQPVSDNEEILRVYANVHGCPAHRFQTTNSAALGAALRAWHGCAGESGEKPMGWPETVEPFTRPQTTIQPDPAGSGVYSRMLAAYESLERRATAG